MSTGTGITQSDIRMRGGFNWSSQHLDRGGAEVGVLDRQRVRAFPGQLSSPGRPSVAWRKDRVRFWAATAPGAMTEDAAVEAGVSSPVGFRWSAMLAA